MPSVVLVFILFLFVFFPFSSSSSSSSSLRLFIGSITALRLLCYFMLPLDNSQYSHISHTNKDHRRWFITTTTAKTFHSNRVSRFLRQILVRPTTFLRRLTWNWIQKCWVIENAIVSCLGIHYSELNRLISMADSITLLLMLPLIIHESSLREWKNGIVRVSMQCDSKWKIVIFVCLRLE